MSNYNTFNSNAEGGVTPAIINTNVETEALLGDTERDVSVTRKMNTNRQENQNPVSWLQITMNFAIHGLLLIFTIYVIYVSFSQGAFLFSWHPTLMTVGYAIFMTEAILSFSENNLLARNRNFKWRVKYHWILQAIGGASVAAGFIIILTNKFINEKSHFQTNHAIVGLVTIIVTALVAAGGIWTKYSYDLREYLRPVYAKLIHAALGGAVYILAVTALILGMNSDFFERYSFSSAKWVGGFILILTGVYILTKPLTTCIARFKTAFMRASL
ncbi:transmembrane reductase CYB561D2-like [Lutzomyia longipalpis]|uniref:transmembrane reductase CYB561D2-like n=1 Tax=Lutzomyia longipalpis TaxID=7200 RepID=UPI0024846BF8|nr:transmembrane reductase CYB561D2-like [Lutzomyia longipalpis]